MKNLIIRAITGALFVIVLVGGIVFNPYSLLILFTVITALTVWEFTTIVNRHMHLHVNRFITTVAGAYLCTVAGVYFFFAMAGYNGGITSAGVFIPYLISLIYLLVSEIYFDRPENIQNWGMTFMAQLYIALPFASLNTLCFISTPAGVTYYYWYALSLFIFLAASLFHYKELTIREVKEYMKERGISVRL